MGAFEGRLGEGENSAVTTAARMILERMKDVAEKEIAAGDEASHINKKVQKK